MKSDTLFFEKGHVVLWKTTRCFMKSDTSFYGKRHVVLWKTIRCFERNQHNMLDRFRLKFAED